METTLRSLLGEMLHQALAQVVTPLQSELGELRALSQARSQALPQIKKNPPTTQSKRKHSFESGH
jgi:hypothetical protein